MPIRHFTKSIVTRFTAVAMALALLGSTVSYFQITRFLREDMERTVAEQQTTLARYIAGEVDGKLQERSRFLETLAASLPPDLLQQPALLRAWLAQRHALQPVFGLGLVVARPDGLVLSDFPELPARAGFRIPQGPAFASALSGQGGIGRPMLAPVNQRPILPMAFPVRNGSGQVVAVLIGTADLSPQGFLDRLLHAHLTQAGDIVLVSPRDKLVVAATDAALAFQPTLPQGANALYDRFMDGYRGAGMAVNAQGVEELSATASVASTGWYVAVRLPRDDALVSVARTESFLIRHSLTRLVLVFFIVCGLMLWLLRPLFRAAKQAEQMTNGERDLSPLPVARADELGYLTAAFNRLLAKLASQQTELGKMAYHDALTGLPNRKLLADRMQQALIRAKRHGKHVAVLFMDLNGFKSINDSLGHEAGDEALCIVAKRLQGAVRQADTLARLGGDEFVLLAPDLETPAHAAMRTLAEKCMAAIGQPMHLHDTEHRLGAAIGIAISGKDSTSESLMLAADKAMYGAKKLGHAAYLIAEEPPGAH